MDWKLNNADWRLKFLYLLWILNFAFPLIHPIKGPLLMYLEGVAMGGLSAIILCYHKKLRSSANESSN